MVPTYRFQGVCDPRTLGQEPVIRADDAGLRPAESKKGGEKDEHTEDKTE